jgi:hypothetical protein
VPPRRERGGVQLHVVDDKSAYFRLRPVEMEPSALYESLRGLLRP